MAQWQRIHLQCRKGRGHGLDLWVGRFPRKGNGSPLQYSCRGKPMGRGAWWAMVHGVAKERERLSTHVSKKQNDRLFREPLLYDVSKAPQSGLEDQQ